MTSVDSSTFKSGFLSWSFFAKDYAAKQTKGRKYCSSYIWKAFVSLRTHSSDQFEVRLVSYRVVGPSDSCGNAQPVNKYKVCLLYINHFTAWNKTVRYLLIFMYLSQKLWPPPETEQTATPFSVTSWEVFLGASHCSGLSEVRGAMR